MRLRTLDRFRNLAVAKVTVARMQRSEIREVVRIFNDSRITSLAGFHPGYALRSLTAIASKLFIIQANLDRIVPLNLTLHGKFVLSVNN